MQARVASITALLSFSRSSTATASMVVPPGEQTMSFNLPGAFLSREAFWRFQGQTVQQIHMPVSRHSFGYCRICKSLQEKNTYAGELPLTPVTVSIRYSGTTSARPKLFRRLKQAAALPPSRDHWHRRRSFLLRRVLVCLAWCELTLLVFRFLYPAIVKTYREESIR